MTSPEQHPVGVDIFSEHGLSFDEDQPNDLEFQPRPQRRLHWLTVTLIGVVIWGLGFLVGVLVDRALTRA